VSSSVPWLDETDVTAGCLARVTRDAWSGLGLVREKIAKDSVVLVIEPPVGRYSLFTDCLHCGHRVTLTAYDLEKVQ